MPSLAEYYRGRLRLRGAGHHVPIRRPRARDARTDCRRCKRDVLGPLLSRACLRTHLGMADTTLVRSEVVQSRLATGYKLRSTGVSVVPEREGVTAGASNAYSTPRDMARYLAALLGDGANEHGTVLKPQRLPACSRLSTSLIPGYRAWDWRSGAAPPVGTPWWSTRAHPRHDSQILVAPDDGVGVMAFTNGTRGGRCGSRPRCQDCSTTARRPGRGDPHRHPATPRGLE